MVSPDKILGGPHASTSSEKNTYHCSVTTGKSYLQVCKTAFFGVQGIKESRLKIKMLKCGSNNSDDCSKHLNHPHINDNVEQSIHNHINNFLALYQLTAASMWWCGPRPCLGWVKMAVGLSEGPSYPGHSPSFFHYAVPLNDRSRAAHSFLKISRLFSLCLFSCPSLARLCFLILLLLMSGNIYPNPGPIFPCSVCTGNVTWQGKSVQCCTCSKWVHLRCS